MLEDAGTSATATSPTAEPFASIADSLNVSVDELAALNHTDTVATGDLLLVRCPPAPDNATAD